MEPVSLIEAGVGGKTFMIQNPVGTLVKTVTLGPVGDQVSYQIWSMHFKGESFVAGTELKLRAVVSRVRANRADRKHFHRHARELPLDLSGMFPHFTDDLDGEALIGYMHTDGFDNWCYDQVELSGMCDRRTLFVCHTWVAV